MGGLESTQTLEAKDVAEKEGFEPSFDAKPHGNRVGSHRDPLGHDSSALVRWGAEGGESNGTK